VVSPRGRLLHPASTMTCPSLSQEADAAALMGSSRLRRCLRSACVLASGRLPICGGKDVDGWAPSKPGTRPASLKGTAELVHHLDAVGFEPLGDRSGVRVSLDKGGEVMDKFR
jgi:hypothetical protein